MGRSYLFECPKCGYRAAVAGGADRGFDLFVQTIYCRDCQRLYDAVVRMRVPDGLGLAAGKAWRLDRSQSEAPAFESALNRLPFPGARRFRWAQFRLRCPVGPTHRVQPWNQPGKCPHCGVFLEKNALPFRVWD